MNSHLIHGGALSIGLSLQAAVAALQGTAWSNFNTIESEGQAESISIIMGGEKCWQFIKSGPRKAPEIRISGLTGREGWRRGIYSHWWRRFCSSEGRLEE